MSPTHLAQRSASIRDVARAARVSTASVSRAFNPATAARVKPATRARIMTAAQPPGARAELRPDQVYRPSFPHTTHFTESTCDVSVLLHTVSVLQPMGFDVKVHLLPPPHGIQPALLATDLAVAGLLFAGLPRSYQLHRPPAGAVPRMVLLSSYHVAGIPSVDTANTAAGRAAARHLIAHGHTALGMVTGPPDSQNAVDRARGFRSAVQAAELALRPEWFVPCDYRFEDGARAARALLAQRPRPTAVFCASDEIALGALHSLRALGLACPRDVSLIGFDNAQATLHTTPPLTTFAQAFDRMVPTAVALLLEPGAAHRTARHCTMRATLIERASVAPPRRAR